MCSLMHLSDDQKRLRFVNPTQINHITLTKFFLSYDQLYLMNYNINMFVCLYSHHWILAMICLKISWIFILNPLDVDESKYNEFIKCIQR
jgi:hypothetical protein